MRKRLMVGVLVVCLMFAGAGLLLPNDANAIGYIGPYGNPCYIDGWTYGIIAAQLTACGLGFRSYGHY